LNTAVVLVGGMGLRLRPLTEKVPKAMVRICDRPLLEWIIDWLRENDVTNIVLGVAYSKEQIMEYFGDGSKFGVRISYSVHTVEGGTGEGFRLAISRFVKDEDFFAMNGDQITDMDLGDLARYHRSHGTLATIAVGHSTCHFGHVKLGEDYCILGFDEKPVCRYSYISTGIYAFNKGVLPYLPERGDVERVTFPRLAELGLLRGYVFKGLFICINTTKDVELAEEELRRRFH